MFSWRRLPEIRGKRARSFGALSSVKIWRSLCPGRGMSCDASSVFRAISTVMSPSVTVSHFGRSVRTREHDGERKRQEMSLFNFSILTYDCELRRRVCHDRPKDKVKAAKP